MEKYTMFMDWKNQYSENEYTTQSNLQIQCNPYQAAAAKSLQSCLTLCDPMNRSMPGLPVHHQLADFTQIHVHRVSDAIQPSHPGLSPSPPAPNPSHSYTIIMRKQKKKLRKQFHSPLQRKE